MFNLADVMTSWKNVLTLTDKKNIILNIPINQPQQVSHFRTYVDPTYQLSWLYERSWHVYSKELEGGL